MPDLRWPWVSDSHFDPQTANTLPALYRMTPRVWNKSIAESKLDHLHALPLCSEGKAVYVSLFNDWQSHGNLKPDGVRALIPNSHVQMGALRSKISQKASSSQSSTRSTLSRCHTSQEIQVSARPIAEPQGSWILPYRLCQVESLDSKETFPLREKKKPSLCLGWAMSWHLTSQRAAFVPWGTLKEHASTSSQGTVAKWIVHLKSFL